jgi:hypothetical protein
MAATFTLKLGGLDLSSFARMNPDDKLDPYSGHFVEPAFSDTPFSDGQVLISTTVTNREQMFPLYLRDVTRTKPALHALIESINNVIAQRPLVLEWRDDSAASSTFFNVVFARFEPDFNFRRSQHGYAAGILHVYTSGYGHTGTVRVAATAAGTGVFLSVPIGSVAGDAPALMDTTISDGGVVPSLGRIIALAPITNPSYTPQIPAASLTNLQVNATVIGASGADGSQYLALPVSPTGGASGIACMVPLPNPTIAGGDNRILAVVQSGIDAGVGMYALDPFGNSMGATAVASTSQAYSIVDLGVCRLPTVGYPTQPKIAIYAGGIWASGVAGPNVLASPAALRINEIFCLPDKNLTLIYERGAGAVGPAAMSKDGFTGQGQQLLGANDSLGNPWRAGYNNANANANNGPGVPVATGCALAELGGYLAPYADASTVVFDANNLPAILTDTMTISAKAYFASPGLGFEEVDLVKDVKASQFVSARLAASGFLSLGAATGGAPPGNLLASVAVASILPGQKYRLLLQVQGPGAFANLSRDDGGPLIVAGASAAFASIGIASSAAVAGAGAPGLAMTVPTCVYSFASPNRQGLPFPRLYSWEVDTLGFYPSAGLQAYDNYRIDGPNLDCYRTSSAGVFSGQKLVSQMRGAFPNMVPSTTSVAVIAAAVDQGVANDVISAVISINERFTYAQP